MCDSTILSDDARVCPVVPGTPQLAQPQAKSSSCFCLVSESCSHWAETRCCLGRCSYFHSLLNLLFFILFLLHLHVRVLEHVNNAAPFSSPHTPPHIFINTLYGLANLSSNPVPSHLTISTPTHCTPATSSLHKKKKKKKKQWVPHIPQLLLSLGGVKNRTINPTRTNKTMNINEPHILQFIDSFVYCAGLVFPTKINK